MDMDSSEDDPPMDCHLPPSKVSPEMLNGWFQVLVCRVLKVGVFKVGGGNPKDSGHGKIRVHLKGR